MPFLYALWIHCGCNISGLSQDYIQGIPLDKRICPVWSNKAQNSESGLLIGIDALVHDNEVFFLESNMNPGFHAERLRYFSSEDPVFRRIVEYSVEKGYKRIVFYPSKVASPQINVGSLMECELENSWRAIASKYDLVLDVIDSPMVGSPWPRTTAHHMPVDSQDTLFVNARDVPNPISGVLHTKGELEQRLQEYYLDLSTTDKMHLPRQVRAGDEVPWYDPSSPFPNIIIKDSRLDKGEGIRLFKLDQLQVSTLGEDSRAYEYVVPDRVTRIVDNLKREFVCSFRIHILLTSNGPVYLGIRKDVSSEPVPDRLTFGPVGNIRAYVSNQYLGAYSMMASPSEEEICRKSSMTVGSFLYKLFLQKHGSLSE
jgi:hypothetical protein